MVCATSPTVVLNQIGKHLTSVWDELGEALFTLSGHVSHSSPASRVRDVSIQFSASYGRATNYQMRWKMFSFLVHNEKLTLRNTEEHDNKKPWHTFHLWRTFISVFFFSFFNESKKKPCLCNWYDFANKNALKLIYIYFSPCSSWESMYHDDNEASRKPFRKQHFVPFY